MLGRRNDNGDTLIEVLFAVAVFSLIVVVALSIMNQGITASQRALEITQVRQEIDSQAETLRFLHEAYVSEYISGYTYDVSAPSSPAEEYYKIIQHVRTVDNDSVTEFGSVECGSPPGGSFILNTTRATLSTNIALFTAPSTFSQVRYDGSSAIAASEGVWIEAVRADATGNSGAIDFHIRACWDSPGMETPMNLGTIVRLYEPRG